MVFSADGVPNDYRANYEIKTGWDATLGLFVQIDSLMNMTQDIPSTKFGELNSHFAVLFQKFPQDFAFRVVYDQCRQVTTLLSSLPSNNPQYQSTLSSYLTNCYKPLTDILKQINADYTVVPKSKVSPSNGPAPLSVTFDARGSIDPANETIPSSNFFWYYKDVDGTDKTIGN